MHSKYVLAMSALSVMAAARSEKRDLFEIMPLEARAVTAAAYQCHASCGYTILDGKGDGYCTDPDWLADLKACLECADEYNLWPDYGAGVEGAAAGCGLDATPIPAEDSGGDTSSTTAAVIVDTTTQAVVTQADASVQFTSEVHEASSTENPGPSAEHHSATTALDAASTSQTISSAAAAASASETRFTTSATTSVPSTVAGPSSNSTSPTTIVTAGADGSTVPGGILVVAAAVFVAAM